jgi:hypothetical protein
LVIAGQAGRVGIARLFDHGSDGATAQPANISPVAAIAVTVARILENPSFQTCRKLTANLAVRKGSIIGEIVGDGVVDRGQLELR